VCDGPVSNFVFTYSDRDSFIDHSTACVQSSEGTRIIIAVKRVCDWLLSEPFN
jgi:hypothetical protein